ncbi:MAG: YceI family protein [Pleurocapsa minor GSE-CHR-MK-17-07R]|jgi:polyisoprenoid-binding protein YceI|nr:YceI family protein [Pleurocapsa minor GSE-CHR-MK 17-07R]
MSKTTRNIIIVALIVVGGLIGGLAALWLSGGDGSQSQSAADAVATADAVRAQAEAVATEVVEAATEVVEQAEAVATEAVEIVEAMPTEEAVAEASAPAGEPVTFTIVGAESSARFELDEDLSGNRITVVGTTQGDEDIAGELVVNAADPSASSVGTLAINVRSLQTDSQFRDRAIRSQILRSADDANEFAIFTPTALNNMPASVAVGESFTFELVGDLTLQSTTNPVTFQVTVTPVSETRLEGSAEAIILRGDFGLTIPSVPSVANVEEEVLLAIDFVAEAAE